VRLKQQQGRAGKKKEKDSVRTWLTIQWDGTRHPGLIGLGEGKENLKRRTAQGLAKGALGSEQERGMI